MLQEDPYLPPSNICIPCANDFSPMLSWTAGQDCSRYCLASNLVVDVCFRTACLMLRVT